MPTRKAKKRDKATVCLERLEDRHLLTAVPFSAPVAINSPQDLQYGVIRDMRLTDLDADGDKDLLQMLAAPLFPNSSADNRKSVLVWRMNDGQGNFGPATRQTIGGDPHSQLLADIIGDKIPDVVTRTSTRWVWHQNNIETTNSFDTSGQFITTSSYTPIAVADLNGNGRDDLIAIRRDSTYWLENVDAENFTQHLIAT